MCFFPFSAWLNPVSKAGKRFDVNKDYHLIRNPQHDFKRLEAANAPELSVHLAVCGADHMDTHMEEGHKRILQQEMHMRIVFDTLPEEEYGWTRFAMRIGTKIWRFFLELLALPCVGIISHI
jgi:hypothetical protein